MTDEFGSFRSVTISWGPMTFAAGLVLSLVTWKLYGEWRWWAATTDTVG